MDSKMKSIIYKIRCIKSKMASKMAHKENQEAQKRLRDKSLKDNYIQEHVYPVRSTSSGVKKHRVLYVFALTAV